MKKYKSFLLSLIPFLLLSVFFLSILCLYVFPMQDISLDLSISVPNAPEEITADDKDWFVFVRDGDTVTELDANAFGAYGSITPGQTIYFSRVMSERLENPTLQIDAVDRSFAVWLDNTLIYTDHPELDNRIGYVNLSMNRCDRSEAIMISLPNSYQGKTLTIAQSFPDYSEGGSIAAIPTGVYLYCGYAYESSLIAESYQTAFPAMFLFLIGLTLLIEALWNRSLGLFCIALNAFAWMCQLLTKTSYFLRYFGGWNSRYTSLILPFAACMMVTFLCDQVPAAKRKIMWLPCLHGAVLLLSAILTIWNPYPLSPVLSFLMTDLHEWISTLAMLGLPVLGLLRWRKSSLFYRIFVPLALIFTAAVWVYTILQSSRILPQLILGFSGGNISYIYHRLITALLPSALISALWVAMKAEQNRRTERRLAQQQRDLTLASYEHMLRQHEEILMLRHDMVKHFRTLRRMQISDAAAVYLDELIGEAQNVRPVVDTGNHMLDILLNTRLSAASDQGIRIELLRVEAPSSIPISDSDLCSLLSNIMDNAITAASHANDPYIRIDCHVKGNFFAFRCENSTAPAEKEDDRKPKRLGYGLKIIHQLSEQHGGMFDTACTETSYTTRIILPISNATLTDTAHSIRNEDPL